MRFTVIGAGAIGGTIGAHLARAGHEVLLVDSAADHVHAIDLQMVEKRQMVGSVIAPSVIRPDRSPGTSRVSLIHRDDAKIR